MAGFVLYGWHGSLGAVDLPGPLLIVISDVPAGARRARDVSRRREGFDWLRGRLAATGVKLRRQLMGAGWIRPRGVRFVNCPVQDLIWR